MAVAARPPCTSSRSPCPDGRRGPRSLRPRSTSITCSARSFGSRWSCSASSWSSAGVAPRGRVPAIGCVVSRSPSTWSRSSGRRADDLEAGQPDEEQVRARVDAAEGAVQPDPVERPTRPGRPAGRTTGGGRARPGSPRRRRSRPWRPRPPGCRPRGRGSCRIAASGDRPGPRRRPAAAPPAPRERRPSRPPSVARSARAPRRSPARRSRSGPRDPACRCAATRSRDRVWVRWSKTRTRSVSMNAAVGTSTGSASGSGTVGSKVDTAS